MESAVPVRHQLDVIRAIFMHWLVHVGVDLHGRSYMLSMIVWAFYWFVYAPGWCVLSIRLSLLLAVGYDDLAKDVQDSNKADSHCTGWQPRCVWAVMSGNYWPAKLWCSLNGACAADVYVCVPIHVMSENIDTISAPQGHSHESCLVLENWVKR